MQGVNDITENKFVRDKGGSGVACRMEPFQHIGTAKELSMKVTILVGMNPILLKYSV